MADLLPQPAAPLALAREALSAIGRAAGAEVVARADADLLSWSMREPEGRAAAAEYLASLHAARKGRGGPPAAGG